MSISADEIFFASRADLRDWLSNNFDLGRGVWAVYYKQSAGLSDLSWDALVEECLCFGWIDSLPGKVDELRTKTYISPRKPGSGWSARNKAKLVELEKLGLIAEPGATAIARAKSSGSWTLFDLAEAQIVPTELQSLLNADSDLLDSWVKLSDSQRRAKLQNFYLAKSDATRSKRLSEIVESLRG
jgi:uncharacterized protein YdeI (YjbR/CyaY-like superfamily)